VKKVKSWRVGACVLTLGVGLTLASCSSGNSASKSTSTSSDVGTSQTTSSASSPATSTTTSNDGTTTASEFGDEPAQLAAELGNLQLLLNETTADFAAGQQDK
jgi:hypothetical protein